MLGNYLEDADILTIKADKLIKVISDDKNDIILDALKNVISRISIYLNGRYDLTAHYNGNQEVPYLKTITINILIYELYKRISTTSIPLSIQKSYDEAMNDIKSIAKGNLSLPELDKPNVEYRNIMFITSKENYYN